MRDSIRQDGLTLATSMLFLAFFATTMRFFIGALLHLVGPQLVMTGRVWFFDFLVLTIETLVLIFLGGLTSTAASSRSAVGFVPLLLLLYAIDVGWVLAQWVLSRAFSTFHREAIPWMWALLNACAAGALLVPMLWTDSLVSSGYLTWVGITSVLAFVVDVILVDYADIV